MEGDCNDAMGSEVVLYGPPGTHQRDAPEFSQFNIANSLVYSRISSVASLSCGRTPSHTQLLSIPSKDFPCVRAEVYATVNRSRQSVR